MTVYGNSLRWSQPLLKRALKPECSNNPIDNDTTSIVTNILARSKTLNALITNDYHDDLHLPYVASFLVVPGFPCHRH